MMAVAAMVPVLLRLTGLLYGVSALLLTAVFAVLAFQVSVRRESDATKMKPERRLFAYSILYLFLLFGALVADRWVLACARKSVVEGKSVSVGVDLGGRGYIKKKKSRIKIRIQ